MEKKFIVKASGEEIKLGDTIVIMLKVDTPFGTEIVRKVTEVNKSVLDKLIANGIVVVVEPKSSNKGSDEKIIWNNVLVNLKRKTGWDLKTLYNNFKTISSFNSWAIVQIVLREIAIELDRKYKDHISKSKEIYIISNQDLSILKISKESIENYGTFCAFRNVEDAKIALNIIKKKFTLPNA